MELVQDDKQRGKVLSLFWLVLLIGFPIWWFITLVPRAVLPSDEILTLDAINPSPKFSMKVQVYWCIPPSDKVTLHFEKVSMTEKVLFQRKEFSQQSFVEFDLQIGLKQVNKQIEESEILKLRESNFDFAFYIVKSNISKFILNDQNVGVFFVTDKLSAQFIKDKIFPKITTLLTENPDSVTNREKIVKFAKEYRISFDLLNASSKTLNWNIEKSLKNLQIKPQYSDKYNGYILKSSDLEYFINAGDWNLFSPLIYEPEIHFSVYVPSENISPLFVVDDENNLHDSNCFVYPQWGGVCIHNPDATETKISDEELKRIMSMFVVQFRQLIGITKFIPSSFGLRGEIMSSDSGITKLESFKYLIENTSDNLFSTISTLSALIRMIEAIPNMKVMDNIRQDVNEALELYKMSFVHAGRGELNEAHLMSKNALILAEEAFFDPDMVAMLYFPDDHKFAVYLPLFFPVIVPVLSNTYKLFRGK